MATTPTKVTPLRSRKPASPPANGNAPPAQEARTQDEIVFLPVDQLVPNPANPRRHLGDLEELAASIRALGILEPLIIAPQAVMAERCCMVVAGHRRLAAAKLAGLDWVPCILRKLSDRQQLEVMLVENLHRADLAPLEEAAAYRRLVELGRAQRQLAAELGRSQGHISKRLALLELPEAARSELDAGGITLEDAQALAKLKDAPERVAVAIEQGKRWGRVREEAEAQLAQVELGRKVQAVTEQLRAAGTKVLTEPENRHLGREGRLQQPRSYALYGGKELPFSVDKHSGEPCHAAIVLREYDGEAYWVCTNPARHEPDGASKLKIPKGRAANQTPEEAKRRSEAKALREATKARTEFMRTWLDKLGPREADEALQHVVDVFLVDANHAPAKIGCDVRGVPPIKRERTYGGTEKDYQAALLAHAKDAPGRRLQAALALAFGLGEELVQSEWGSWSSAKVEAHFAYLQACGYQLSPFEAERLAAAHKEQP